MRKVVAIILFLHLNISAQESNWLTYEKKSDIYLRSALLLDVYKEEIQVLYKKSAQENFFNVFQLTQDSIIYNDWIPSSSFNDYLSPEEYLDLLVESTGNEVLVIRTIDINILEISPILNYNDSTGNIEVVVNKKINFTTENPKYNLEDDKGEIIEYIEYQNTFKLKFYISFDYRQDPYYKSNRKKKSDPIIKIEKIEHVNPDYKMEIFIPKYKVNIFSKYKYLDFQDSLRLKDRNILLLGEKNKYFVQLNKKETESRETSDKFFCNSKYREAEARPLIGKPGFFDIKFKKKWGVELSYKVNFYSTINKKNYPISYQENYNFSIECYPISWSLKHDCYIDFGLKLNSVNSSINLEMNDYQYSFLTYDPDNYLYNRIVSVENLNENYDFNKIQPMISFKFVWIEKLKSNFSIAPFGSIDLGLRSFDASYNNQGLVSYSGNYSDLFNITITDELYDFGLYQFSSQEQIFSSEWKLDNVDLNLGTNINWKSVGVHLGISFEMKEQLMIEKITEAFIPSIDQTNSFLQTNENIKNKNCYFVFGLNFKL